MEKRIQFIKQRPLRVAFAAVCIVALIIHGTIHVLKINRRQPNSKIPPKWIPVDCHELLDRSRQLGTDIEDPNDGELLARWTTSNPPFFVSVHQFKHDRTRRVIYDSGEYHEMALTATFSAILKEAPVNSRVIDVGGNIGWFSLVSAAHGHHVDVFEPNQANRLRLCESKLLNGWGNAAGSSDVVSPSNRLLKRGTIDIRPYRAGSNETTSQNPGHASFLPSMIPKWRSRTTNKITTVPLDLMARELKWFDRPTPIIILKVDVEGCEPAVFAGAKRLLQSGLIDNIFMEITSQTRNDENAAMVQLIIDSGYHVHQAEHLGKETIPPMDQFFVPKFLKLYGTKAGIQENIWWKRNTD